jgi:hypothetical protein
MVALPKPIMHTVSAIWCAYEKRSGNGCDSHGVNMSDVAHECERSIWYKFRWACTPETITGVKQRRFDTGNLEEERLLDDLESAGMQVERLDPATGSQFRVELADGWLRGKMDGRVIGLPEAPQTLHVVEAKSLNERGFKDVTKKQIKDGMPSHYAQCQSYMAAEKLTRCLYIAVNKNTDELYAERIEYDRDFVDRLIAKVRRIVAADVAPPKAFPDVKSKAAFVCQWCPAKPQCHEQEFARVNCRTCISCEFRPGAVAYCNFWDKELDFAEQQAGCPKHLYLPSLVPGEQIDASEDDRRVTYRLTDGSVWVDGK